MADQAMKILSRSCYTRRCLRRVKVKDGPDKYECRKINNLKISKDNTSHTHILLPVKVSHEYMNKLIGIDLLEAIEIDKHGTVIEYKALHAFWKTQ